MQNRLHPIFQTLSLVVLPLLVLLMINYIFSITGRVKPSNFMTATLKMSIFILPNVLYIILHKYKLTYLGLLGAGLAAYLVVNNVSSQELENFSNFSLYLVHFIYFSLMLGVTYLAYYLINGFKLKNIVFIMGGIIVHTLSLISLFLINKHPVDMTIVRSIMLSGTNLYLMIGLAIAIGLLFFELPEQNRVEVFNDDPEDF